MLAYKVINGKCGGSCVITTAIPGDNSNWGVTSWGSTTNNYVDTRVLSQYLQLPAHTIGNENWFTRISAHVLWWYPIVAWNVTMPMAVWLEWIPGCYLTKSMFMYYPYVYALTPLMPNHRLPNNWFCYRSLGTMQVVKYVSVMTEEDCETGNGKWNGMENFASNAQLHSLHSMAYWVSEIMQRLNGKEILWFLIIMWCNDEMTRWSMIYKLQGITIIYTNTRKVMVQLHLKIVLEIRFYKV